MRLKLIGLLCLISLVGYSQNDSIVFILSESNRVTIYRDGHGKRLPPYTTNTNGKVLGVTGGVLTWVNQSVGSSYDGDPSTITQDATHRFATDAEKTTWNAKQDALGGDDNYVTDAEKTKLSNLSGTNTGDQTTVSGNAGTATTLQTARKINGVDFNGSLDITVDNDLLSYQALGSPIVSQTVGQQLAYSNVSTALVDGQIKFTAVYLPKATTLTGIKVYVRVLGVYTGDNNNRVGLYSYSGGVLTLVASSANNSTLWTSAANAVQTIPFSSTYAASSGIYFVGILYNNSAQTTAPTLASGVALNNLVMGSTAWGFTNSAKLYGTANGTNLTTPINMTAITSSVIPSWVALY
jgi:hypothetical protein